VRYFSLFETLILFFGAGVAGLLLGLNPDDACYVMSIVTSKNLGAYQPSIVPAMIMSIIYVWFLLTFIFSDVVKWKLRSAEIIVPMYAEFPNNLPGYVFKYATARSRVYFIYPSVIFLSIAIAAATLRCASIQIP
jgi:hypothetical protein